jgi:hypothetical protein
MDQVVAVLAVAVVLVPSGRSLNLVELGCVTLLQFSLFFLEKIVPCLVFLFDFSYKPDSFSYSISYKPDMWVSCLYHFLAIFSYKLTNFSSS